MATIRLVASNTTVNLTICDSEKEIPQWQGLLTMHGIDEACHPPCSMQSLLYMPLQYKKARQFQISACIRT